MLELAGSTPPILDANPIEAPVAWIVASIGSYLQSLDPGAAVVNPLHLLLPLDNPTTAVAENPLARIVPTCGGSGSTCDFQRIADSVQTVGYMLFAILLLTRMLRLAATGQLRSPEHVLFDLVPKLVIGIVAMQMFDRALNDLSQLSMTGAFLLEDAMLGPIDVRDAHDILSAFPTGGFGVALLPVLYLLVAYLLLLVVTSRLVLLLGALVSPLGIPIALQNEQGRLAATWIRMIVSGLLVPVLAGIGTAGSLALAWLVHRVAGDGPFFGSYLGAVAGECGLAFTAFATTAMFRDVVKQGMAGVRGSFEAAQMGPVATAPGQLVSTARRGTEAAAGVAVAAAAAPAAAALAAGAAKGNPNDPEPGGDGLDTPVPPRLPGGSGGSGAGSQMLLPQPPGAEAPAADGAYPLYRRIDGGRVIYEFERLHLVRYATYLSESTGDADVEPELGRARVL
jgi:hypothetical protein